MREGEPKIETELPGESLDTSDATPKNSEHRRYRENLAEQIKREPDKEQRQEILRQAKITEEYREARRLKLEQVDRAVETQEELDSEREKLGLEPKVGEVVLTPICRQKVET